MTPSNITLRFGLGVTAVADLIAAFVVGCTCDSLPAAIANISGSTFPVTTSVTADPASPRA